MEEQYNWIEDAVLEPFGPGIEALPETYPWKRLLQGFNETQLFQALLPTMCGAIFTGPTGNGRHTQAQALAYSLIKQKLDDPENFEQACFIQIEPSVISPVLEESVMKVLLDELYRTVETLLKGEIEAIAIIFDQIDLYPRSFMDRIAEHLIFQSSKRLFTLCIGRNEARISRNLKRQLPHCRCLMPSEEERKKYLRQIELIPVVDNWTDAFNPTERNIAVVFEDITIDEIAKETEGCSYADLQDLLWLIKLGMSNSEMEDVKQTENIVIHVLREDVLYAIRLCRSAADEEQAAPLVTLQQPLPLGYTGGSVNQNVQPKSKRDDEELDVHEAVDFIQSIG